MHEKNGFRENDHQRHLYGKSVPAVLQMLTWLRHPSLEDAPAPSSSLSNDEEFCGALVDEEGEALPLAAKHGFASVRNKVYPLQYPLSYGVRSLASHG